MTFRESDSVVAAETGQFRVTAAEPKRRGRPAQAVGKVGAPPVDDELDRVVDSAIEIDATPALSDEALRPSASPAEDPVRLYLKEIGKVSLLKASEEVSLGQRIEIGQIALRRALGRVPFATSQLLALVDRAESCVHPGRAREAAAQACPGRSARHRDPAAGEGHARGGREPLRAAPARAEGGGIPQGPA